MTFEIYKLEWILSRHTFGNTTRLLCQAVLLGGIDCIKIKARHRNGLLLLSGFYYVV